MGIQIAGLIIGVLVLGAGIYYLVKEKHDPESHKIYGAVAAAGVLITALCAWLLLRRRKGRDA